jgi:hypothetical protein
MRQIVIGFAFLVIAGGAASAQEQAAKPFAAVSRASTTTGRRSRLSQAEQMRRRPDILTGKALNDVLSRFGGATKTIGETVSMSSDEKTFYVFVHRTENSRPEVHARWDDLVIVQSGTGAIEMGDSLVGSEFRAMGERIGGRFHQSYKMSCVRATSYGFRPSWRTPSSCRGRSRSIISS